MYRLVYKYISTMLCAITSERKRVHCATISLSEVEEKDPIFKATPQWQIPPLVQPGAQLELQETWPEKWYSTQLDKFVSPLSNRQVQCDPYRFPLISWVVIWTSDSAFLSLASSSCLETPLLHLSSQVSYREQYSKCLHFCFLLEWKTSQLVCSTASLG